MHRSTYIRSDKLQHNTAACVKVETEIDENNPTLLVMTLKTELLSSKDNLISSKPDPEVKSALSALNMLADRLILKLPCSKRKLTLFIIAYSGKVS